MRIHYTRRGSFSQELQVPNGNCRGWERGCRVGFKWARIEGRALYIIAARTPVSSSDTLKTHSRGSIDRRRLLLLSESGFIFEPKRLCTTSIILYTYTYIGRMNELDDVFPGHPGAFYLFPPTQISILCTHESCNWGNDKK